MNRNLTQRKLVQADDLKVDLNHGDVAVVDRGPDAPKSEVFPDRSGYQALLKSMEDMEKRLLSNNEVLPDSELLHVKSAARTLDRLSREYAKLEIMPQSLREIREDSPAVGKDSEPEVQITKVSSEMLPAQALLQSMEGLEKTLLSSNDALADGGLLEVKEAAQKLAELSREYVKLETSPQSLQTVRDDSPTVVEKAEPEVREVSSPQGETSLRQGSPYSSSYTALSEAMESLKERLLAADMNMPEAALKQLVSASRNLSGLANDYSSLEATRMSYTTIATGDKVLEVGKLPELIERYAFDQADLICDQVESITKSHGRAAAAEFYGKFDPNFKDGLIYNRFSLGEGALPVRVQKPGAGWKTNLLKAAYSVSKATLAATEIVAVNSGIFMLNAVEALSGGTCLEPLRTKSVINSGLNHMFGSVSQKDFWRGVSYSEAIFYNALKTDPKNPEKRLPEWNDRRLLMLEEFIKKTDELERLQALDHQSKVRHHAKDRQNFEFYEGKIRDLEQSIMSLSPDRDDQMYIQRVMKTYKDNPGLQKIMKNTILGVPIRERLAGCVMKNSLDSQKQIEGMENKEAAQPA